MRARFARQVRTDTPRAPQLRIFISSLPGFRRLAPASPIGGDKSHLLRVTVSTTFAAINNTAARHAGRQFRHAGGGCLPDLTRQCTSRQNTENYERKNEESHSCNERHRIGGLEPASDSNVRDYRRGFFCSLLASLAFLIQWPGEDSEAETDKSHNNGDGANQPHPPVVPYPYNRSCPGKMGFPVMRFDQPRKRQVRHHENQPDQ